MLLEKQEDYKRIALWFDFFFFLKFILSIFFLINPKFKGLVFLIGVQFSLSLIIFLGWCLLLPQVFFSYQLIWIICVICPLLSFSFVTLEWWSGLLYGNFFKRTKYFCFLHCNFFHEFILKIPFFIFFFPSSNFLKGWYCCFFWDFNSKIFKREKKSFMEIWR